MVKYAFGSRRRRRHCLDFTDRRIRSDDGAGNRLSRQTVAFAVYHGTSIVIRKLGIFLIILLGLLVFILSPAGLHAVVRVASWFLPGQLTYQSLHGELGKVIDVKNVTYRSETIDLKISSLHFTWHPWSLFHKEIQVK